MMQTIIRITQKYDVLAYFILTIIITWGCMLVAASPNGFPITDEQFETAGALIYVAMLVGPAGAGLMLIGLLDGRAGFRELLNRLTRWRVSWRWYVIAILMAPAVITLVLIGLSSISSEFQPAIFSSDEKFTLVISSIVVGLVVGFFEELGWTGFAIPRLRLRYSVLATGLIVGWVWGAWHFPPFLKEETFSATLPFILLLGQLFSWLPPYRILMVWVFNRTGSLLIAILMHASLMGSLNALVPVGLSGTNLLTWIFSWAIVLWVIVMTGRTIQRWSLSNQPAQKQIAS